MCTQLRVQLAFLKLDPDLRRADPSIGDRLATVTHRDQGFFHLVDDLGDTHLIEIETLQAIALSPRDGRWVIRRPVPTYDVGEELTLAWRHRDGSEPGPGYPSLPDRSAWVVEETPEQVTVEDDRGERCVLWRHGVEDVRDGRGRQSPRWRVIKRGGGRPVF
jgi:hypothetical protein